MMDVKCITHNICLRCASLGLGCCNRCRPFILTEDLRLLLKNYPVDVVKEIVEVGAIPTTYLYHLQDPEMSQIYYFWDDHYYRLQTKFLGNSCIALLPNKGCMLGDNRPLICKVWPFWWKTGADPSAGNFQIEINGDCTMAIYWGLSIEDILKELGYSENSLRRDLLTLSRALEEHGKILKEAGEKKIPVMKLLDWIISKILGS